MGLLSEIQKNLLADESSLGSSLLKLKFLASRLGSDVLEEWVSEEIEGYPPGKDVPLYRKTSIVYNGTFSNGYHTLNRVPISTFLIQKHAGEGWLSYDIRQGIDAIESILKKNLDKNSQYAIDTGNLVVLMQNKIYENATCVNIDGVFDISAFQNVKSVVRSKLIDLTLKLEKQIPESTKVTMEYEISSLDETSASTANNVTKSVVYNINGPFTQITNSGSVGAVAVNVAKGNIESLIRELKENGLPEKDANEIAEIIEADSPESSEQPLSKRALDWLKKKTGTAAADAWAIGKGTAGALLTAAAKKYYGL